MLNIHKTHLRRIIFSMTFLSNLRVKSHITKNIENNIFEGITYQYYILLLFDFVIDFQNKQKNIVNYV